MTIRIVAVVLGVLLLGGTIVLAVAGASGPHSNAMGPLAFLACIVAVVVMIVLGVTLGGRNNPRRAPHRFVEPVGSGGLTADPATDDRDQPTESM